MSELNAPLKMYLGGCFDERFGKSPDSSSEEAKKERERIVSVAAQNAEIIVDRITQELKIAANMTPGKRQREASSEAIINSRAVMDSYIIASQSSVEGQVMPPACKVGCNECCHGEAVSMTGIDAQYLVIFLLATKTRKDLVRLVPKLKAMEEAHRNSKHGSGTSAYRHPCAFLEDGKCSVYEARPSTCKNFQSSDPGDCGKGSGLINDPLIFAAIHRVDVIAAANLVLYGNVPAGERGHAMAPLAEAMLQEIDVLLSVPKGHLKKLQAEARRHWKPAKIIGKAKLIEQ